MRGEGRLRAAGRYVVSAESAGLPGSADEFQIAHFIYVSTAKKCSDLTPVQCFYTFSYPSHLKHLFLKVALEDGLPEMLSQLGVLAERGIKKSKKKTSRDSSDCKKLMIKCQVTKMLTVKTQ